MAWSRTLWAAKGRALSWHLALSALILIPFTIVIAFVWFPGPLFTTDGGWQGLRIMLFVDMVIGPALTFLVFNPSKSRRETAMDLGVIALIQAAALTYGYLSVESQRPMAVVFSEGEFVVVAKDRFKNRDVPYEVWASLQPGPPYWAYVQPARDIDEQLQRLSQAMNGGFAPHEMPETYRPLAAHLTELEQHSRAPKDVPDFDSRLEKILRSSGRSIEQVLLLSLKGYYRTGTLVLDRDDGRVLGAVYSPKTVADDTQ